MKKILLLGVATLALFANPNESRIGWQGSFEINIGYISKKSNGYNAIPFGTPENKKLNSLNQEGETLSTFLILPRVNGKYLQKDGSGFSIGNQQSKDLELAYFTPTALGNFEVAYTPGFGSEWDNPFETTKNREESIVESHSLSAKLKKESITGKIFYKKVNFNNDKTINTSSLGRSGHENGIEISKKFGLHSLDFLYSNYSAIGKADSFSKNELSYSFIIPFFKDKTFIARASLGENNYQKTHPIFNKKREDSSASLMAMGIYRNIFNDKRRYLTSGLIYSKTDSTIQFFDDSTSIVYFGIGQKF